MADIEQLRKIGEFESTMNAQHQDLGWEWTDVGVYPGAINKMIVEGTVKISFKSNSMTGYLLTEKGKAMILEYSEPQTEVVDVESIDDTHMFDDISGHEDIKDLIATSLKLEKPIHILLTGPPALAKSLFLWDIERTYGSLCLVLMGSATSHAGLWDAVEQRRPRIILFDEIEKMRVTDQASLLSLMEEGRIIRTKVGREIDIQTLTWVIGTSNKHEKLTAELKSRFKIFHMQEYSIEEFKNVVINVLVKREGTTDADATEIASRLVGKTHSVRDAIRVARLSKAKGINRAIELLIDM